MAKRPAPARVSAGDNFTVNNPVSEGGKYFDAPILTGRTFADCTLSVDYYEDAERPEKDGGLLVTVSFYIAKDDRKKHRLQTIMDDLKSRWKS